MSKEDFQCAVKDVLLLNMKPLNEWALPNRHNWMESQKSNGTDDEKVTEDLLSCPGVEVVCKYLGLFVQETQKENDKQCPPATICCLRQRIRERC